LRIIDMGNLTLVGGSFDVRDHDELTSVVLSLLSYVGGHFVIESAPKLIPLDTPLLKSYALRTCTGNEPASDLAACSAISGSIDVVETSIGSVSAAVLTRCVGSLRFDKNALLVSVVLPRLTQLSVNLRFYSNPQLVAVYMPLLSRVTGYLRVYDNIVLTSLFFPALTVVNGDFYITANPRITLISLPVLSSVQGYFYTAVNAQLAQLSIPRLSAVLEEIGFCQNAASFVLPTNITSITKVGKSVCNLQAGNRACANVRCP
jgi:hypothetical protein